jgi:hypothetical protein
LLEVQGGAQALQRAVHDDAEAVAEGFGFVEGVRGEEDAEVVLGNAPAQRVPNVPTAQRVCSQRA